jgi:hypothetical protein
MVLAVEQILTLKSEAMHLRPGAHPSDGTMGAGYQRIPGIQLLGEYNHHVLVVESVAGFVAPALVDISTQFIGP